jgi:hypothetical protein
MDNVPLFSYALMLGPLLAAIAVGGVVAALCIHGYRATRMSGWRLLAAAALVRTAGALPSLWMTMRHAPDMYSRAMGYIGLAHSVLSLATTLLVIFGVMKLTEECKQALGKSG